MRRTALLLAIGALLVGMASPAAAAPSTLTQSSYGIEGAFGIQDGDTWISVYALAYDVNENGDAYDVVAPTIFVDGSNAALECWAYTTDADVTAGANLTAGAYTATLEGLCFDWSSEESSPFTISLDVEAIATGRPQIRGASYADDGYRCVSKISQRDATATGSITLAIPDHAIDLSVEATDTQTALTGFESTCHPMNGQIPEHEH